MSNVYESIADNPGDGYENPANNAIYENEPNDYPMTFQGGQMNAAFESNPQSGQVERVEAGNSDPKTVEHQNTEQYEQLDFSGNRTEAQGKRSSCKIDRKILVIVIGVILLLIVVVIAVSVTMVIQSDGNDNDNDSGWAKWSSWGSCSVSCGTGTQERLRLCKETTDNADETICPGPDRQTQNCTVNCPINGVWTAWSNWNKCSAVCGNGNRLRTRTCSNPAPQYGGQDCSGSGEQTKDCTVNCHVDGAWAQWSSWSSCSARCIVGVTQKTRHRTCTDPAPEHGGQECSGSDTETGTCTESHCSASVCFDSYTTFDESYRRESVTLTACPYLGERPACDQNKVTGYSWYRFKLATGENGLLSWVDTSTCPNPLTCGTCHPISTNSSHPTQFGVIKDITMGASWSGGCFRWSGSGSVTKCSVDGEVFYLYKLWRPTGFSSCGHAYCAGTYSLGED